MKHFSFVYLFLILFLLFSNCSKKEQQTILKEQSVGLSVKIELLKEYPVNDSILSGYDPPEYFKNKRFDVRITLENHSDSTISIVMMTCSWEENFIINTPYIEYIRKECDSNFPHLVIIRAHDKFTLNANLEKSKYITECETCTDYSKTVLTRLGFIYIPHSHNNDDIVSNYDKVMKDKSRWHILWSNPLLLNKL